MKKYHFPPAWIFLWKGKFFFLQRLLGGGGKTSWNLEEANQVYNVTTIELIEIYGLLTTIWFDYAKT